MADNKFKIWISDHYEGVGFKKLAKNLAGLQSKIKAAYNSAPVMVFRTAVKALNVALAASVVEGARFNVQMAKVWTMAPGGIKDFGKLREQARGIASDFGLARSAMAKGMYNALSAGIDKKNLEGFMKTAAKVAVADGSDISVAVDGITTVLNAFKIEAGDAEKVTDDLFQTVAQGKTTFAELSSTLATVAPMAAASNIPLKQILAHVATLTAQGTPTAQAMTQIRASIQGMNKALGDGWADNMSYQDALKQVWMLAGESQTELLKMVGSTEAVQAILGGVGQNADLAREKLQGMADTAGSAQEAFEKVNQFRHWQTAMETVRGTLSKLGEYIDSHLRPYVLAVTEQIKEWRDDSGLWDKLSGFLDNAESKLKSVAAIVAQIQSVDEVKFVAEVFGEYVVGKLKEGGQSAASAILEKAPIIGDAIGQAVKSSFFGDGFAAFMKTREEFGQDGNYSLGAIRGAFGRNKREMRSERLHSEGQTLSDSVNVESMSFDEVLSTIKQGLTEGIAAAANNSEPSDAGPRLAELLEAGLTGQELEAAVAGMELTAEEMDKFIQATTGTVEAAKKSSEIAVGSNKAVQEALKAAETAATKTSEVAAQSIQATQQITAVTVRQASELAQVREELDRLSAMVGSIA